MQYILLSEKEEHVYPVALLTRSLNRSQLTGYTQGLEQDMIVYSVPTGNKSELLEYFSELLPLLSRMGTKYLVVTDAAAFKALAGTMKVSTIGGYVFPCVIKGFEDMHVLYGPDPRTGLMNPAVEEKINQCREALMNHRRSSYIAPGSSIIKEAHYLQDVEEIAVWLDRLLHTELSADIETFSLRHYSAGIASIAFAWDQHSGIAFPVDLSPHKEEIRKLLKDFFTRRTEKLYWHRAAFDCYVLIYQLWMTDLLDTEGLLQGLEMMMKHCEDTQVITYLATNSCAGNTLGLKEQAQEFAGNYAVDIQNIEELELPQILEYNLVDALSTLYVRDKHLPTLIQDKQEGVYELFKGFLKDIIHMQLVGLPLNMEKVIEGKAIMEKDRDSALLSMKNNLYVRKLETLLLEEFVDKKNKEYKKKRITVDDVPEDHEDVVFTPASPVKLQKLLYGVMQLPVLEYTDSKQPATGGSTCAKLLKHTDDPECIEFLNALVTYKMVDKILNTFVAEFEKAPQAEDGWHYLFGFYNLGGTQSGRLSSSQPNLTNLPANAVNPITGEPSPYAKLVKKMFSGAPGWLFVGVDFNSLEDVANTLLTRDPNKMIIYEEGYDSHSYRAYYYFKDQMPDIENTKESINSIQKKYKPLRQKSKAPSFSLSYFGTYQTLMTNCGFSESEARRIENAYHEMYEVSDKWSADRIKEASLCGYVTLCFGLRLRTPALHRTILGNRATPKEAEAEKRSAGNALGQSYCMLNSRAANGFMKRVRSSKHALDIRPCAQIHDAQYYLIRNSLPLVHWVNQNLIPEVKWQELPELEHDVIKVGGELSIFYPDWSSEIGIPNNATPSEILSITLEYK